MHNFILNTFLWTFAIYGIIKFLEDIWLDACCYIIIKIKFLKKYIKNLLLKE